MRAAAAIDQGAEDATAQRREHAHAPVAQLVPVPLDEDGPVVGHDARRALLVGEVLDQVLCSATVQAVVALEAIDGGRGR